MRIAITGAHSVGKTTLINQIVEHFSKKNVVFDLIPDASRIAYKLGFATNEETTIDSEMWIFSKHIEMEMTSGDNYITDKCFVDLLAYAEFIFEKNKNFLEILRDIAAKRARKYDLILYIPVEIPLENDGVRSMDPGFRDAVDEKINIILKDFKLESKTIKGNRDERIEKAIKLIEEKFEKYESA